MDLPSQTDAMELQSLGPEIPQLLVEMGINYDPDKLAAVLASKWPAVRICHLSNGRHVLDNNLIDPPCLFDLPFRPSATPLRSMAGRSKSPPRSVASSRACWPTPPWGRSSGTSGRGPRSSGTF